MTQTAADDAERADKELNAAYKQLVAVLDKEGKAKLISAQRAWLELRDAEAELYATRGGMSSSRPLLIDNPAHAQS